MTSFSPKYLDFMGGGVSQFFDNKIARPFARFMINRTQLKLKSY